MPRLVIHDKMAPLNCTSRCIKPCVCRRLGSCCLQYVSKILRTASIVDNSKINRPSNAVSTAVTGPYIAPIIVRIEGFIQCEATEKIICLINGMIFARTITVMHLNSAVRKITDSRFKWITFHSIVVFQPFHIITRSHDVSLYAQTSMERRMKIEQRISERHGLS